jgi:hypothetical protein
MNIKAVLLIGTLLGLAACSSTKEQLGLVKKSPDEFAVVKRAPLTIPADISSLPRPHPGAPRPQEQATSQQAKEALFGTTSNAEPSSATTAETSFLAKAGVQNADPNIRQRVDAETTELNKKNVPVAKKLLGMSGDPNAAPVSVVNAKEEAERLKKNQEEGKPATAGKTPTVEK